MLTDDDLDRRLADAGGSWRDVHTTPATVQPPSPAPTSDRSRVGVFAVAALVAATVIGISVGIVATRPNTTATVDRKVALGAPTASSLADLPLGGTTWTVRSVTVHGQTFAATGTSLRLTKQEFEFVHRCDTVGGSVIVTDTGRLEFATRNVTGVVSCPAIQNASQERRTADALEHLVRGKVQWRVDDSTLTLVRGDYAATFTG